MAAKIDMICPLIKEPCLRKKCICYDVAKEDYMEDAHILKSLLTMRHY